MQSFTYKYMSKSRFPRSYHNPTTPKIHLTRLPYFISLSNKTLRFISSEVDKIIKTIYHNPIVNPNLEFKSKEKPKRDLSFHCYRNPRYISHAISIKTLRLILGKEEKKSKQYLFDEKQGCAKEEKEKKREFQNKT